MHNLDDLILLLDSITTKFSVIVITETLKNHNADLYTIYNYDYIHSTRINTKGGSISIYINRIIYISIK